MGTEVWFRDPLTYVMDALVNGVDKFTFSRETLVRHKIDAVSFMRKWCVGTNPNVEFILVGSQGASHYKGFTPLNNPVGVYPVWSPDMDFAQLEAMVEYPVGEEDPDVFKEVPPSLRPVPGQIHRVVIKGLPYARSGYTLGLMERINSLIINNPDCKFHLHGMQHFQLMFSNEWTSIDFDASAYGRASNWWYYFPNGVQVHNDGAPELAAYEDWINMLGFQLKQIATSKRAIHAFNIKSALWAAEYFTSDLILKMRYKPTLDEAGVPKVFFQPATQKYQKKRPLKTAIRLGLNVNRSHQHDFVLCNSCVHRATCRLMRVNSVCIYKGAETVALADAFGSRDADKIINGLSDLIKMQADRTERAIEVEATEGESDPEVTKQINSLMKNGVMLAKLIKPELNGKGVTINNNVNNNPAAAVAAADPRQLVASAVRALEAQGIPREDITQDMIKIILQNPGVKVSAAPPLKSIEGVVVPDKAVYGD